jgi:transcription-repair coupling factor (superfamily II helicase)
MANADSAATASDRLLELVGCLERQKGFAEVVGSLHGGHAATLDGVWGSSCALVAATLAAQAPATLVVVCPQVDQVDEIIDDLTLFTRLSPERFAASESFEGAVQDEVFGQRLHVLKLLQSADAPKLAVTSIQALLQPVPSRETLGRQTRELRKGGTVAVEDLAKWLVENGLVNTSAVELPGEFSLRGGIVDIFAPDWDSPVRVEFFGDEIESIRQFEISTQRSLQPLESIDVTLVAPTVADRAHLADYQPPQSWFLLLEPMELDQNGRQYLERVEQPAFHTVSDVLQQAFHFPSVAASAVAAASLETTCRLMIESVERFSGDINRVRDELDEAGAGQEVFVICQTDAEVRRLRDLFDATQAARDGRLYFPLGSLQSGFRMVPERIVLLSSGELFRRADLRRPSRRKLSRVIDSFLELREGDLVVHIGHGIARYRGLKLLEKNGQVEEHLELEFSGRTKLYVPSTKIGLVQNTSAGPKAGPRWPNWAAACGAGKRSASRKPSATWRPTCSNCRPRAGRGRASPSPPIRNGSASSTPRSPITKRTIS